MLLFLSVGLCLLYRGSSEQQQATQLFCVFRDPPRYLEYTGSC